MFELRLIPFYLLGAVFMIIAVFQLQLQTSLPPFIYTRGQCVITDKSLTERSSYSKQTQRDSNYSYAPVFKLTVHTTDQHRYQTDGSSSGYGYSAVPHFTSHTDAQAILDSYDLGQSYACWYDLANPTHAVLVRELDVFWLIWFFIGGGIAGGSLWLQVKINQSEKRAFSHT